MCECGSCKQRSTRRERLIASVHDRGGPWSVTDQWMLAAIEALESISNNACCGDCQEAKRVAADALQRIDQLADG